MSFWGCVLQPGSKFAVQPQDGGEVLHLSQACLHNPQPGKNYLQVESEKSKFAVACLEKGKSEYASFDLFFRAGKCTFINTGKSEIHLTGYFEPDGMGDDILEGEEEEEETDDEEEEEEEPPKKKSKK
eukprot:gb/GFBE01073321.1/.p1 GENE.gb/GFBE01073321.1/~~gb/GFBE01073321.1/.p1  ORF type:complete len:128 (+),score=51.19 gb/GFBE01073321.1/:1-384(+)